MVSKKAKLIVILKADGAVVAEVENPELWRNVLAAIHQDSTVIADTGEVAQGTKGLPVNHSQTTQAAPIAHFAKTLGVSQQELIGALDPSSEAPYLHLDAHCWEEMKKQTPGRGPGALSPTGLAGTLLSLWFKESGLGHPTQSQALEVLKAIGIKDTNSSRGVKKTKWLQGRGGGVIVLNPAQISKAVGVAKSFCLKKWSQIDGGANSQ